MRVGSENFKKETSTPENKDHRRAEDQNIGHLSHKIEGLDFESSS